MCGEGEIWKAARSADGPSVSAPIPEERLLRAGLAVIAESGASGASVEAICGRARLPTSAFYQRFTGRVDCLSELFDVVGEIVSARLRASFVRGDAWEDGARCALRTLLAEVEEYPQLARFLIVEPTRWQPDLFARRQRLEDELALALEAWRPAPVSAATPLGPSTIVATIFAVLHSRLVLDPVPTLGQLVGPLMGVVVLPYLGVHAAQREVAAASTGSSRRL